MAQTFIPSVAVQLQNTTTGKLSWLTITDRDDHVLLLGKLKDRGLVLTGKRQVNKRPEQTTGVRGAGYARRTAYLRG